MAGLGRSERVSPTQTAPRACSAAGRSLDSFAGGADRIVATRRSGLVGVVGLARAVGGDRAGVRGDGAVGAVVQPGGGRVGGRGGAGGARIGDAVLALVGADGD